MLWYHFTLENPTATFKFKKKKVDISDVISKRKEILHYSLSNICRTILSRCRIVVTVNISIIETPTHIPSQEKVCVILKLGKTYKMGVLNIIFRWSIKQLKPYGL